MISSAIERLRHLVSLPDQDFSLAEAALLIAKDEYPDLDVAAYISRLDELARKVRAQLPKHAGFEDTILILNQVMFEEQGFAGDTDNYYDPRNSFLNEVLDRKLGIPLTLSIVYMEIGRRLGLPLEGVPFPWHFLVKVSTAEGDVVLDPFSGGICLSEEDLVERLEGLGLDEGTSLATFARTLVAQPMDKKQVVLRMLRNLKGIYLHKQDYAKALAAAERILLVAPDMPEEIRDRGSIYARLECFQAALNDYRRYLQLEPAANDAAEVHQRIIELQRLSAHIN